MDLKKGGERLYKNIISAGAKGKREKDAAEKDPILERRGERVYVLFAMFVTSPTSHAERSPLKSTAPLSTAPHNNNTEHCKKI